MAQDPWVRHLAAFTQALGVENAPFIFTFSKVGWKDDDQRDEFIKDLTGVDLQEAKLYG
jgi:hypothetical protein